MARQTLLRLIHSVLAVGTALTIVFGVIVSATQPNYPEADNILPIFACFPYALLLFVAHTSPVRGMNVFLVGICVTAIVITLGSIYPLLEFCVLHPTVKSGGIFAKLPLLQIFAIVAGVCLSLIAMGIYKFRSERKTTVSSIDMRLESEPATVTPKTLSWCVDWKHLKPMDQMMMRCPVIGTQKRIYADLIRQLKTRNPEDQSAWESYPAEIRSLAGQVSCILIEYLGWPKYTTFLPDDPADIAFWDRTGDLASVGAMMAVEMAVGREMGDSFWEKLSTMSFSQVVQQIIDKEA